MARERGLRDRVAVLEEQVRAEVPEADLDGRDPGVRRVLDLARRVAPTDPALLRHAWPGNLRELRNAIERAATLAEGPGVGQADLPERIAAAAPDAPARVEIGQPISLERLEAEHLSRVLAATSSR